MTDAEDSITDIGGCVTVARSVPLVYYKRFSMQSDASGRVGSVLSENATPSGGLSFAVVVCIKF